MQMNEGSVKPMFLCFPWSDQPILTKSLCSKAERADLESTCLTGIYNKGPDGSGIYIFDNFVYLFLTCIAHVMHFSYLCMISSASMILVFKKRYDLLHASSIAVYITYCFFFIKRLGFKNATYLTKDYTPCSFYTSLLHLKKMPRIYECNISLQNTYHFDAKVK